MPKERALTLDALRVMDAIERRGSFAAAAEELGKVPSALSYTMQKLEDELDVVLFDRSGHRTKFTNVGRLLLERGRFLLDAADKLAGDAEALARGWEPQLTIVCEALVSCEYLYPLVNKLEEKSHTQLNLLTEVLAGAWESLEEGRADIVIAPTLHFRTSTEINSRKLYSMKSLYVASADHPILNEPDPDAESARLKYRGIAVADSARIRPTITVQVLDRQSRLTVSNLENKYRAIVAGLGVGTLPYPMIAEDLRQGRLKVISDTYQRDIDVIMAWRRDSMGEAKSWALREIPKLFAKKFPQS